MWGTAIFADQALFDDVTEVESSFVIRIREDSVLDVTEERLLSQEALDAGVVRDAVVKLPQAGSPGAGGGGAGRAPPRRTRRDPKKQSDLILLATSLLDLPAELVALIYLYRYTVELFFRTFKSRRAGRPAAPAQPAGGRHRHLPARRDTVIVCLLICLITGKRPDKATRNMIGWFLIGLATEQELLDHLNKPDHTGAKKRAKDELWKKLGY